MPLNQQFFASIRRTVYPSGLPQSAVDACNTLFDVAVGNKITSSAQFAYILATVHGEAGPAMVPIDEFGKGKNKRYGYPGVTLDPKTKIPTNCLQFVYYGRGWPQITWYDNYLRLGEAVKMPLTTKPELMLQVPVSAAVTVVGMRDGLFTKHKLDDFFQTGVCDWINARRIINGTDKAETFASVAKQFYNALVEGGVSLLASVHVADPAPSTPPPPDIPKATPVVPVTPPRRGLFWDIMSWFGGKK